MNSTNINNNNLLSSLKHDRHGLTILFIVFILGFILGLLFKHFNTIKQNASTIKAVVLNFDTVYKSDCKMVFCVRTDLKMNKGKICSQCCHACLSVYEKVLKRNTRIKNDPNRKNNLTFFDMWKKTGQKKVVLKVSSLEEMYEIEEMAKKENLITSIIADAGRTQIEPNTETVIAIEPVPDEIANKITGHLKLL
ncbi:peptidyl-tRNA hydrolase 2, putative [Hepatocystis sp. ex Piliocolobus tephrosceles]|uniref:Peptidyl-tRNA hydrolase 2, mitochondrial n=1 Tax=Piliocolobus tephrosceles TaxID=591936 RepID=A0A8C9GHJ5_9PRIM|nr:peptidyl-tRNA hydrolase 2, putative [Hepatocystis sp. ex Piliocolobus tephrosceles]